MTTEIHVPELGESVVEATIGEWLKKEGEYVAMGEALVELETDKVDVEVGAETAGVLVKILKQTGDDVQIGDVLGLMDPAGTPTADGTPATDGAPAATSPAAASAPPSTPPTPTPLSADALEKATPVARRMAAMEGVDVTAVSGTGPGGRITKLDVSQHLQQAATPAAAPPPAPAVPAFPPAATLSDGRETRSKMSRRRRTIATRLVEAQQTAAMLTTFNEVDMSAVMQIRQRRQDAFVKRNGIKLGFSSFFVKAVVGALKAFPLLNAEIDGDEIVVKHYYDIGMAVGAEEGLVVPVIRHADRLSFADIEHQVKELAQKARDGSLGLEDLRGGTFTITNGGIFGSMLSTPILNPPQVGILGLHNIVERPVALNGQVEIRPIMYLALSYDHRIVDGREAVQFLVRVKELIEDPESLLLEG